VSLIVDVLLLLVVLVPAAAAVAAAVAAVAVAPLPASHVSVAGPVPAILTPALRRVDWFG
jgi:hypothetical protein